ncbi:hypothetical protein SBADM41S_01608 [Streptomyces badius]
MFTAEVPAVKQLAGAAFVAELAERTGGTPATARWDAGVVLSQIAALVGDDLVAEAASCLPPGYALLFGGAGTPRPGGLIRRGRARPESGSRAGPGAG